MQGAPVGIAPTPDLARRGLRPAPARPIIGAPPPARDAMITRLEGPLRREISIDGRPYVLTISPSGMLLTEKGRRKGFTMDWTAFVSGEVALASALNASLAGAPRPRAAAPAAPPPHDGAKTGAVAPPRPARPSASARRDHAKPHATQRRTRGRAG
jgi:hypothetical protein